VSNNISFRENILQIKPYVPGKPIEYVQREFGLTDVIKLASNENPLGPSPKAIKAMQEAAVKMNLYPDGYCTDLRAMVAKELNVPENYLIFGNGSDEVIRLIGQTFIRPGDEVVVADPSFVEYDFVCYLLGGNLIKIPVQNFTHNLRQMAQAITDKTKIVFICNPNNPTGTMVTSSEVKEFLSKVPDHVLVVFDEAYYEYVDDETYPDSLGYIKKGRNNIIALRTFSKIHGLAGLRLGYGIAVPELIQLIQRTKEPFNANLMAQVAAMASLQDKEHLLRSRDTNKKGKEYLYKSFTEMGLEYIPTQGNFMMVNISRHSQEVFVEMQKRGVIVRTGDIFGLDNFIRVTIGTQEQNERFINVLKEILRT